jgi:hypothetical protein
LHKTDLTYGLISRALYQRYRANGAPGRLRLPTYQMSGSTYYRFRSRMALPRVRRWAREGLALLESPRTSLPPEGVEAWTLAEKLRSDWARSTLPGLLTS